MTPTASLSDLALQVGLLAGGALLSASMYVIKKLTDFLAAKTKSSELRGFWARTDDLAERVVKETYQATVKPLQDAGKWTPEAAAAAKLAAVSKLKSFLGPEGLKMLEYLLIGGDKNLDAFLGTFVEAAVHDTRTVAEAMGTSLVVKTVAAVADAVKVPAAPVEAINPPSDPAKSS